MLQETLQKLFDRDLQKLKLEISLYKSENNIWLVDKEISNSAGNLCLHLIGNLNHFIGSILGGTDYVRNRELEFSSTNIPQEELINAIEKTIKVVLDSLHKVTAEQLQMEYPLLVFAEKTSTEYFLVHLSMHLAYHLGQINYHRRLLDN
jgi:uncharacterized damage-inducible protein DinB